MKLSETRPDGSSLQVIGSRRGVMKAWREWHALIAIKDAQDDQDGAPEPQPGGADARVEHAGRREYESDDGWDHTVPVVNAGIGFTPNR